MDHNYFLSLSEEELQEILTGYALGALEPDEMIAVDEYLQDHPERYPLVQRLEEASIALAFGAPQVSPPSVTKATLMARVQADLDVTAVPLEATTMPRASNQTAPRATSRPMSTNPFAAFQRSSPRSAPVTQRSRRRRFNWSLDSWFDFATGWKVATMASCAALLFFIIATTQLSKQLGNTDMVLSSTEAQLASATGRLHTTESELTSVQTTLNERSTQLAGLEEAVTGLAAENSQLQATNTQLSQQLTTVQRVNGDLQTTLQGLSTNLQTQQQQISSLLTVSQVVELGSTQETTARGSLFVGEDSLVLILSGLEPLPEDETYELWLIPADSNPISAGLVQVTNVGSPSITANIRLTVSTFAAVGLSIEKEGGSTNPDGPEGPVILLGERAT